MDENPYQSPESEPEVEKRPSKPPNRYSLALFRGFFAWVGLTMLQEWGLQALEVFLNRKIAPPGSMIVTFALIALPVGVMIAWWTSRVPESKWARVVAMLSGLSPLALFVFGALYLLAWPVLN
jgi:hypothetical protein